jgi:hypothetical protein
VCEGIERDASHRDAPCDAGVGLSSGSTSQ